MIVIDREDFLEKEELYDDFNAYGLPTRPRTHRGIAHPYSHKRRKIRVNSGGTRPMSRPKRTRPIKGAMSILLPRKKAIKFGEPRGIPLEKFPILKMTPPAKAVEHTKEATPIQRKAISAKTKARAKAKALKEEITQKEVPSKAVKPKMSTKKKLLIIGLTIITVTITGYFIYNAQKNKT